MKNKLLTLALIFIGALSVHAQVGKGLFIGGTLGLTTSGSKNTNGNNSTKGPSAVYINVTPRLGYFLTDNIAVGVVVGYGGSSTKTEFDVLGTTYHTKTTSNTLSFGLFGRYALPLGDGGNFFFLGDLNLGFGSTTGKTTETLLDTETKANPRSNINIGIAPGILFFPTPKIGLEAGLGNIIAFNSTTITDANDKDIKSTDYGFNILNINTLAFNFGLNYYFNR